MPEISLNSTDEVAALLQEVYDAAHVLGYPAENLNESFPWLCDPMAVHTDERVPRPPSFYDLYRCFIATSIRVETNGIWAAFVEDKYYWKQLAILVRKCHQMRFSGRLAPMKPPRTGDILNDRSTTLDAQRRRSGFIGRSYSPLYIATDSYFPPGAEYSRYETDSVSSTPDLTPFSSDASSWSGPSRPETPCDIVPQPLPPSKEPLDIFSPGCHSVLNMMCPKSSISHEISNALDINFEVSEEHRNIIA